MVWSAIMQGVLGIVLSLAVVVASQPAPLIVANQCGSGAAGEVHFTLAFTGDTFLHENIQAVGETAGYAVLFDPLRPFLRAADLTYTNFDGAMLSGSPLSGYPDFNYNPALAPALRDAGIDLVSTANNHILDRGPEGVDATLAVLAEHGIQHHGAVPSTAIDRPAFLPLTITRDDGELSVGFISATWGTNGIADPYNQINLLYTTNDYESQGELRPEILAAIELAARNTDLVIVAAHWGFEYESTPHPSQIRAAEQMAAAGADIIIGTQPHTLQPVTTIEGESHSTFVAYSLGNLIASQGAMQAQFFTATSAILYIGVMRAPDGAVHLTGSRYLPTIHVANDTRPAPLLPGMDDAALNHVRSMLRDPSGFQQLSSDSPPGRVDVCPSLTLAEAPDNPIPGDFARFYATLGNGVTPRPLTEAITVFGLPLGPVVDAPLGDCVTPTRVLYTERQRLEWYPDANWPYRITGSLLGVAALERTYPDLAVERRLDLADPQAFADPRFRSFFERYGGLAIFGYPISGALTERDPLSDLPMTVQYFERARFELDPLPAPDAGAFGQVRLGLIGREIGTELCAAQPVPASDVPGAATAEPVAEGPVPTLAEATPRGWMAQLNDALDTISNSVWWLVAIVLVLLILTLAILAVLDFRLYLQEGPRRRSRSRRRPSGRYDRPSRATGSRSSSAMLDYEYEADTFEDDWQASAQPRTEHTDPLHDLVDLDPIWLSDAPSAPPPRPPSPPSDDDELLRQLLSDPEW